MLKRNYLGALSLFAAGAMLLSACVETATPTAAPVPAAGPTQTPTPCACSASLPTLATPTAAPSTAPATSAGGATGQVTIGFAFVTTFWALLPIAVQVLLNGDNANTATTVMGYALTIIRSESARYLVAATSTARDRNCTSSARRMRSGG